MPLYEYKCDACEQVGEYLQKINAPAPEACRFCGKGPLQKKVSQSAFVLKGEGWYVTDFRDKSKKTEAKPAASGDCSSEATPAAKPADTSDSTGKSAEASTSPTSDTGTKAAQAKPSTSS